MAQTCDGTGCEFKSWKCRIYIISDGYISYPMFIKPTITRFFSGFSGQIWPETKIVLKKCKNFNFEMDFLNIETLLLIVPFYYYYKLILIFCCCHLNKLDIILLFLYLGPIQSEQLSITDKIHFLFSKNSFNLICIQAQDYCTIKSHFWRDQVFCLDL